MKIKNRKRKRNTVKRREIAHSLAPYLKHMTIPLVHITNLIHIDIQQIQADETNNISPGLASMCAYYGYELWENEKFDLAHKIYTKAAELDPSPINLLNLAISHKEYLHDSKHYHELLVKVEGIFSNLLIISFSSYFVCFLCSLTVSLTHYLEWQYHQVLIFIIIQFHNFYNFQFPYYFHNFHNFHSFHNLFSFYN